ncbi:MAG TPA: hypothetical protein VHW00_00805 [Thermoanaerobaculia bacterium]|nr:hypothetical protein [Thermoanaerobaculia bacterium]
MKRVMKAFSSILLIAIAIPVMAQGTPDIVTVASVTGSGVVDVPVYIRDTAATPLGIDQPAGSRIQSYSLRVTYSPASAVQSISFSRAGITAPLTPTFENSPSAPGSIALLGTFDEATNLIPFTSNATLPGNQVAHLLVTIAPGTTPGTNITLTLDPVLTQLTDDAGSPGTIETVGNGRLQLVNGAILVVSSAVPTLAEWALGLLAAGLALVALRMRLT